MGLGWPRWGRGGPIPLPTPATPMKVAILHLIRQLGQKYWHTYFGGSRTLSAIESIITYDLILLPVVKYFTWSALKLPTGCEYLLILESDVLFSIR